MYDLGKDWREIEWAMGNSTSRIPRELSSAQHSTTNCHCISMNSNSIWLREISQKIFKLICRSLACDHWNLLKKQLCLFILNYCFEILEKRCSLTSSMPAFPWVYYPAQQDATKCHWIENVFLPALKPIEVNWTKLRFFSICNCKKLKIRRRKTYTNYCWFLLSLILYLFVARNRHNMQCNAYTHQLSWPHILTRGGGTVSNILDAKWSASWNESCFLCFY